MSAAVVLVLLFTSAFLLLFKSPVQPSYSRELSQEEQRHISSIVRKHAIATTFKTFTSGEFKYGWQRLRDLRKAVVYAQGNQPDGKIWIHVGVPDATQGDGYRLFGRHFFQKKDDRWSIVADF